MEIKWKGKDKEWLQRETTKTTESRVFNNHAEPLLDNVGNGRKIQRKKERMKQRKKEKKKKRKKEKM